MCLRFVRKFFLLFFYFIQPHSSIMLSLQRSRLSCISIPRLWAWKRSLSVYLCHQQALGRREKKKKNKGQTQETLSTLCLMVFLPTLALPMASSRSHLYTSILYNFIYISFNILLLDPSKSQIQSRVGKIKWNKRKKKERKI